MNNFGTTQNLWYVYRHVDDLSLHAKRYFGVGDIDECKQSDFVLNVWGPFPADSNADALAKFKAFHNK